MNEYLAGVPQTNRLSHQAPVSWRIIPTVLATAARAVRGAEETGEQSLQSVAHNPVYIPPNADYPNGRAISPGGFHNQQASRAIDILNAAGADICALAAKHTSRLLDGVAFGLPKLLVPEGSAVIGTEFLAWSQTSHSERARQAAMPALLSNRFGRSGRWAIGRRHGGVFGLRTPPRHLRRRRCRLGDAQHRGRSSVPYLWTAPATKVGSILQRHRRRRCPFGVGTHQRTGDILTKLEDQLF